MTPLIRECVGLFPNPEELMWFDLGKFDGATLYRGNLPFYKCAVVAELSTGGRTLLICHQGDNILSAFAYGLLPDKYVKTPLVTYVRDSPEDGWQYSHADTPEKSGTEGYAKGVVALSAFVGEFLNRTTLVGYRPTAKRNSILNRQRARKGKPPLQYDWHTVTIQPPQAKSEPKGGTHASPRLHDRRGHFRKLKSGLRVWVNPCKVGNASKGTVFKDYKVG